MLTRYQPQHQTDCLPPCVSSWWALWRSIRMHHCAAVENRMWLLQAAAGREARGLTLLSFGHGASVARQRPSLSSWLTAPSSWAAQSNDPPSPCFGHRADLTHRLWERSIFVKQTPRMSCLDFKSCQTLTIAYFFFQSI